MAPTDLEPIAGSRRIGNSIRHPVNYTKTGAEINVVVLPSRDLRIGPARVRALF